MDMGLVGGLVAAYVISESCEKSPCSGPRLEGFLLLGLITLIIGIAVWYINTHRDDDSS